jgi:hypothetical protein
MSKHHKPAPEVDDRAIPMSALLLGAAGVLPFLVLALAALLRVEERFGLPPGLARAGLLAYGVVIVSFLGGIRWGVGLLHKDRKRATALFVMSILAPLVAWIALFMPRPHDFVIVIACLLVLGYSDVMLSSRGTTPRWYGTLRGILTAAVVAIMIFALAMLPLAEMP